MQQTYPATRSSGSGPIEVFEYPAGPDSPFPSWDGWAGAEEVPAPATEEHVRERVRGSVEAGLRAEFEQRLAEETRRSFEAGRERGRLEGRESERQAQEAAMAAHEERRLRQAAELVETFARERERYLEAVEPEVVKLALAVAARILRREAQMDPLLLTGAVRVALGQLSSSTQIRLRVPPADLDLWEEAIALLPNLETKPTVLAGEGMRLGDCEIETEMGSVDLGVRAQMAEIERGFFDRAGGRRMEEAARPAVESGQ